MGFNSAFKGLKTVTFTKKTSTPGHSNNSDKNMPELDPIV